ncbi:MAG TPA: phytoene/squalene synthase family protein [Terriglobia bacterium]|nr:phytoene/squalene synthase family protein [Terriglobia bacterium]
MSHQNLNDSYQRCQELAKTSNFYSGLRFLPSRKRRALAAVYAFMRECDDISDRRGNESEKRLAFVQIRSKLDSAMAGDFEDDKTLPALQDTIQSFQIPLQYFYQAIDGTEMDLTCTSYNTFEELYRYCYHVASVVGLICIHIFGFREQQAIEQAIDCGIAFQLTNILRDIREDLERNRIYLPREDLERFSYTRRDFERQVKDERFKALMAFEVDRAQSYYSKARPLVSLIDRDSRPAFTAMFESYWTLLQRIKDDSYSVWNTRIRLNTTDKLRVALKALAAW